MYDSQQHTEPSLNLLLANNQHNINVVQSQAIPKRKRFQKTHETLDEKILKVSKAAKNEMLRLKNNSYRQESQDSDETRPRQPSRSPKSKERSKSAKRVLNQFQSQMSGSVPHNVELALNRRPSIKDRHILHTNLVQVEQRNIALQSKIEGQKLRLEKESHYLKKQKKALD